MNWDHKTLRLGLVILLVAAGITWLALRQETTEVMSDNTDDFPLSPIDAATLDVRELTIGPTTDSVAPDFSLETLDGQTVSLSDLRGQVVLINFWATWCPPCREEMPAIQSVYDRYRDQGFTVLAVNLLETNAEVTEFTDEMGLTFPILMDRSAEVFFLYRVRGLPTTFFLDQAGVIQSIKIGGPMAEDFIEGQVTDLLAGEEKAPDVTP